MTYRPAGSHQFVELELEPDRQGGSAGLTDEGKGVSVDTPRGHEAEDIIRDIIYLSERLIHLLVKEER